MVLVPSCYLRTEIEGTNNVILILTLYLYYIVKLSINKTLHILYITIYLYMYIYIYITMAINANVCFQITKKLTECPTYLTSLSTLHSDKNDPSLSLLRTFLTASVRIKCSEQYFDSEKNCSFEVFASARYRVASSKLRLQRSFLTCCASSITASQSPDKKLTDPPNCMNGSDNLKPQLGQR